MSIPAETVKSTTVPSSVRSTPKQRDDFDIIDDLDDDGPISKRKNGYWKILVVDDESDIHESTKFALKGVKILDKEVQIHHAYTAEEGVQKVQSISNIALILLDVVMESPNAGLKFVEIIRNLGYTEVRIILRTGQPGYAPELTVLNNYDINDYRTKSELTRTRLISCLTAAFRSYQQIHIINSSRRGLELIIKSARDIFKRKSIEMFAKGVLTQLISLRGEKADGLVFLLSENLNTAKPNSFHLRLMEVITATEKFEKFTNRRLADIESPDIADSLVQAFRSQSGLHLENGLAMHVSSSEGKQLFIYVDEFSDCDAQHATLLKVFAGNIAIAFENLALIERLDQLAYIDPILNLPNANALNHEIEKHTNLHHPLTLVTVHINQISHAISVFGLEVVNHALVNLRKKIIENLSPPPLCVASDGKEDLYILVRPEHCDIDALKSILEKKISVDNIALSFSTHISIVDINNKMESQSAIRNAISTLILAGHQSNSLRVAKFDKGMTQNLNSRIIMQSSLREALEFNGGVQAYLQPKVDCKNGRLVGAEALCRWELAGTNISPVEFVPIAEAGGLASKLTDVMLEQIAEFTKNRTEAGLPVLPISVNLSMNEIQVPQFADIMHQHLLELGLSPDFVDFEITESVMMLDPAKTIHELNRLRELGYVLAIDDFGTGYSSLNYLHQLPVNCLKIDKVFIDDLNVNSAKASLAATSISIAEKLGLTVIAEGIETSEQHAALQFLGCNTCQGFYFGKPIAAHEFSTQYG